MTGPRAPPPASAATATSPPAPPGPRPPGTTPQGWGEAGPKTPAPRLGRDCHLSPRTAKAQARQARQLRHMPLVRASFEAGRISSDHVAVLARADQPHLSEVFARDEAMLVGFAKTMGFEDFRRSIDYWRQRADDHSEHTAADR